MRQAALRWHIFLLGYVENEQDKKFSAKKVINKEKAHHTPSFTA